MEESFVAHQLDDECTGRKVDLFGKTTCKTYWNRHGSLNAMPWSSLTCLKLLRRLSRMNKSKALCFFQTTSIFHYRYLQNKPYENTHLS